MSDKNRDTIVLEGMGNSIPSSVLFNGHTARVTAWSAGNALSEKEVLEEFIRKVSNDGFNDPGHEARKLMNEMGWA